MEETYLFKISVDGLIHMCIARKEAEDIMLNYHSSHMETPVVVKEHY